MNKLDELLLEWKKDAEIDPGNISNEIQKIPRLHSKYLDILSAYKLKLKESEIKYNTLYLKKYEYHQGLLDLPELRELGWEPILYTKRVKTDIPRYLDADEDLNKIKRQISFYAEIINACELIMKELNARNFSIKSLVEWIKFTNGC